MRKWALIALISMTPLAVSAAQLILRDGTVVRGAFIGGTSRQITFQDERGARRQFDLGQVQSISFDRMESPAGASNGDAYRTGPPASGGEEHYWAVIPAGTELAVRTDEGINSNYGFEGRTFTGTIQRDIVDTNGNVVVPRGSPAQLVIRQVQQGGTLNNGYFVLDLEAVQVNGRWHHLAAEDLRVNDQNGLGANRRTGEMVGGGAALGTLLGAVAGGGKGAAIGAIAGAIAVVGCKWPRRATRSACLPKRCCASVWIVRCICESSKH
jgi:hypothetical protein